MNRFPDDDDDDDDDELETGVTRNAGKKTTPTLKRLSKNISALAGLQTDEIQKLMTDIEHLEQAIQSREEELSQEEAWKNFKLMKPKGILNQESLQSYLDEKIEQMDKLVKLTGIIFTQTNNTIIKEGKDKMTRRKIVEGSCGETEFTLDMTVEESMKGALRLSGYITRLDINVSEDCDKDLHPGIERLAGQCDLQGFLRVITHYKTWKQAQQKVFHHFCQQHPDLVVQKDRETLTFQHPNKNCAFDVRWGFTVSQRNTVLPDIDIRTHVSKKALKGSNVLETAGDRFQLMLKELGVEKTLNTLVQLLTT